MCQYPLAARVGAVPRMLRSKLLLNPSDVVFGLFRMRRRQPPQEVDLLPAAPAFNTPQVTPALPYPARGNSGVCRLVHYG